MLDNSFIKNSKSWLKELFASLTSEDDFLLPSEWAVQTRHLPTEVTSMPGPFSFDIAPYLIEILDCFSPHSPVREIIVMKGVQVCFTVGVLENSIGYFIDHIKNHRILFYTADAELAIERIESNIIPMINHSGLEHLIKSSDEKNSRKTGKKKDKIEWQGGGLLKALGAQNPNKMRSMSVPILLCDEIDGWPDKIGKDGDPVRISKNRTNAYESSRKILLGSTPLIAQTSKISREYEKGDKRKYLVPCKHCGELQELVFNKVDENGVIYGLTWTHDDEGILVEGTVKYLCKLCQGEMINHDKTWMYRETGKHCRWVPTSKPDVPFKRSYHVSALYSPVGMETWESIVRKWLDCWNVITNTVKDVGALQEFYNNVLGRTFEAKGESLKLERVVMHRRFNHYSGQIPNNMAFRETGGKILFLTCAVDVHKEHLDVQVVGWCKRGCFYSIEWHKFEGDCHDLNSEPWQKLRDIIGKVYKADDGRLYRPIVTFLDQQYATDVVLEFCNEFQSGVYPIRGTKFSTKGATLKEFSEFKTKMNTLGFNITTSLYKRQLSTAFRREWDGETLQPEWYPNFPQDYPEIFFKELTIEHEKAIIDKVTGRIKGYEWIGRGAHAWDTMVYNRAAHDMIAFAICQDRLGLEYIDRNAFWDLCESEKLYFEAV